MKVAKIMSRHFENMHGSSLNKNPNVMTNIKAKMLSKCSSLLPDEIIGCLILTKTFLRFNQHNNKNRR